ncbi:MAG: deoxynucleoside kinase [Anaerolineales bacterium]|jgi:deoxyadenosine/deoxycytidine kinase
MKKYVAVAGNIGVGKSTLVKKLCEKLGWEPYYEPVAENPYLEDFYEEMNTWAFHSQVYFLTHRLHSHRELMEYPTSVVQDRSVYEDAEIFAKNLYLHGHINERDYATYRKLFDLFITLLPHPDLVVYLRASVETLRARIDMRGRQIESNITGGYLVQLNELYEEWIADFSLSPILIVPADEIDFVAYSGHLDLIVEKVEEKLRGKEEVIFAPEDIEQFLF